MVLLIIQSILERHYVNLYDYRQCFDSMWLQDSLISLWQAGVKNEMLSLIMKLNEIANIVVNTLHGTTEKICAETIVKQGTVLGPILCSTSTAEFCGVKIDGGSTIGDLKIG